MFLFRQDQAFYLISIYKYTQLTYKTHSFGEVEPVVWDRDSGSAAEIDGVDGTQDEHVAAW